MVSLYAREILKKKILFTRQKMILLKEKKEILLMSKLSKMNIRPSKYFLLTSEVENKDEKC